MFCIECRGGITFPLIVQAVAVMDPQFTKYLSQCLKKDTSIYKPYEVYFKTALQQKSADRFCEELVKTCTPINEIDISPLYQLDPVFSSFHETRNAIANGFPLDPAEICFYISCAAYSAAQSEDIRFFCPGMSINSSIQTLEILKGSYAVLKENVPEVSVFLAEYLLHGGPFLTEIQTETISEIFDVSDPLNANITARVFRLKENDIEEVSVIETNIDDMTPELISGLMQILLEKGALDVWVSPVTMKKSRLAFWLTVLVPPVETDRFADILLRETSTFGIRYSRKKRKTLKRDIIEYSTPIGTVHIKRGFINGKCIKAVPEYDDMSDISRKNKIPLSDVFSAVNAQIYNDLGLRDEQE